jgi:hypothetical protein
VSAPKAIQTDKRAMRVKKLLFMGVQMDIDFNDANLRKIEELQNQRETYS